MKNCYTQKLAGIQSERDRGLLVDVVFCSVLSGSRRSQVTIPKNTWPPLYTCMTCMQPVSV